MLATQWLIENSQTVIGVTLDKNLTFERAGNSDGLGLWGFLTGEMPGVADQVLQTGTGKAFPHEPIAVGKRCANAGETKNTMTT